MFDEDYGYEADVFDQISDDFEVRKPRAKKPKSRATVPSKAKPKTLSKAVVEMQERYDLIAENPNATKNDWQVFFKSIEKFIMNHAFKINFNRYIEKDSELWGFLTWAIMESIVPKTNPDGTRSCWFIDPFNKKLKEGYKRDKANIGNYLLNRVKWLVITFNNEETDFVSSCADLNASPVPDEKGQDFETKETEMMSQLPYTLEVRGQVEEFRKELESIWNIRTVSTLVS